MIERYLNVDDISIIDALLTHNIPWKRASNKGELKIRFTRIACFQNKIFRKLTEFKIKVLFTEAARI